MGRRRRKTPVRRRIRTIPTVFNCPQCGRRAIRVEIDRKAGVASVHCGNCECHATFPVTPLTEPVDVYADFIDAYEEQLKSSPASPSGSE